MVVGHEITSLYSFVWEPILNPELTSKDIIEFSKKLPELQNALSCCVCDQIMTNREVFTSEDCHEHFACKACCGKERIDSKKCTKCQDWESYKVDDTLKLIIKGHQKFCFYFLTYEPIIRILEVKHEADPTFDTFKLLDLVGEGAKGSAFGKKKVTNVAPKRGYEINEGVVPNSINITRKRRIRIVENANSKTAISSQSVAEGLKAVKTSDVASQSGEDEQLTLKISGVTGNFSKGEEQRPLKIFNVSTGVGPSTEEKQNSVKIANVTGPLLEQKPVVISKVIGPGPLIGNEPTTSKLSNVIRLNPSTGNNEPIPTPSPKISNVLGLGLSPIEGKMSPKLSNVVGLGLSPIEGKMSPKLSNVVGLGLSPIEGKMSPQISNVVGLGLSPIEGKMSHQISNVVGLGLSPIEGKMSPQISNVVGLGLSPIEGKMSPQISNVVGYLPVDGPKTLVTKKPEELAKNKPPTTLPYNVNVTPTTLPYNVNVTPTTLPYNMNVNPTTLPYNVNMNPTTLPYNVNVTPTTLPYNVNVTPTLKPTASYQTHYHFAPAPVSLPIVSTSSKSQAVNSPTVKIKVESNTQASVKIENVASLPNEKEDSERLTCTRKVPSDLHYVTAGLSNSPIKVTAITASQMSSGSVGLNSTASSTVNINSVPIKITPSLIPPSSQATAQIYQITNQSGILARAVIRPQQFRLASNVTIQGRSIPVPGYVIGPSSSSDALKLGSISSPLISSPINAGAPKRKIIVTSATPAEIQQQWPDPAKVLQFAGEFNRIQGFPSSTPRPCMVTVSQGLPGSAPKFATVNVRPVVSGSLVRPSSNTVSLGPNVTVSTAGLGGSVNATLVSTISQSAPLQVSKPLSTTVGAGSVVIPEGISSVKQVAVSSPTSTTITTPKRKQDGCRCGNATVTPGKLTCIGQRCACYADGNACSDCKCKGCKNPYLPGSGGKKLLHGMRALLDPQTNHTISIVAPINAGPNHSTVIPNATVAAASTPLVSTVGASNFGTIQTGTPGIPQQPQIQLIPVRFGQTGAPQFIQITNAQALQQLPFIFSSGHLQAAPTTGITIQGVPVSGLTSIQQIAQHQRQTQMNMTNMTVKSDRNSSDGN